MLLISISFLIVSLSPNKIIWASQECENYSNICKKENNCRNCIQAHYCCLWCSDQNFQNYRCNIRGNQELLKCNSNCTENNEEQRASQETVHLADIKESCSEENNSVALQCSGCGNCRGNKCHCFFPCSGEFCQYVCPFNDSTKLICGGHGNCVDGACRCRNKYVGEDCTCLNSTKNCKRRGNEIECSNNGKCVCDKCKCDEGFSGRHCERCDKCGELCKYYEHYVAYYILTKRNISCKIRNTVRIEMFKNLEIQQSCSFQHRENRKVCQVHFTYSTNEDDSVDIKVVKSDCHNLLVVSVGLFVTVIVAVVLLTGISIMFVNNGINIIRGGR
jgi:hypothetical protein